MPDRGWPILILAVIAVAVLAGRSLVEHTDGLDPAVTAAAAGTDGTVLFDLADRVDRFRIEAASLRLARAEARHEARRRAIRLQRERFRDLPGSVSRATLESIAECESGGDPRVVSSNGLYHGKYQFSLGTWSAVGGEGSPSAAPEAEQDYRAALLYTRSGPGQWPVCGS